MAVVIAGREVGGDCSPLVIADIGINHSGNLNTAKQMVDAAHRAGVEVVKHQTHVIEDEMSPEARKVIPGNADVSIYEIMESCALSEDEEFELMRYVESKDMIFLSTPFSRAAADRLQRFGVSAFKIGSGELNHYPLIDHISSFGKPMIISTGMNDIKSIAKTVDIVRKKGVPFVLMHTTNLYPTPVRLVRLGAMVELHNAFPDVPFGLSDHTLNNNAAISAIALGASVVERHFTDSMDRKGPDISCSMDEAACAELIRASKEVYLMRGGSKHAAIEEQVTMNFAFATLVAIKPIEKDEIFSMENLWAKRPGTGELKAEYFFELLGKRAATYIPVDAHITYDMVAG